MYIEKARVKPSQTEIDLDRLVTERKLAGYNRSSAPCVCMCLLCVVGRGNVSTGMTCGACDSIPRKPSLCLTEPM